MRQQFLFLSNSLLTMSSGVKTFELKEKICVRKPIHKDILTHLHSEQPKQACRFGRYFTCESILLKTFEGEMFISSQTKIPLQIFCELSLQSEFIIKSMKVADCTF